ncbi:3'-5' exonuclease-like [Humulus lupulus]|uniref:3'-5' exonuclease-like n=1 Tax=Humulus lupulus TaxID=3486 RepID=UPI002B4076D8|nr:3'-5' exonuclease-like [Humulus lupulus]
MQINIVDHQLNSEAHNLYDVQIGQGTTVRTLVTTSASMVDSWISETQRIHNRRLHGLIVGLDVEWRPSYTSSVNNPVAIIQLCVGHRCLIFQILHADYIPRSLVNFLGNSDYRFVGVGVAADVDKLIAYHQLSVRNPVELRDVAARKHGDWSLKSTGLKGLARYVLGMEIEKPNSVTMSRWDNRYLDYSQVQYACVDAYLSFEIGKTLMADD